MRPDLAAKYDLRVPRYTSYPTAPHFTPAVGADRYGQWLSELPPDAPLSLYVHVAYCAEMCWFCGCHTKITRQYAPVADYMDCVWREIDMVAARLPGRMTARHMHFGGGSPTILTPEDFVATVERLRNKFLLAEDAEIAVELDPRTADEAYVRAMAGCGVTRASIGVQDFNPQVQEAINRIQPYDVTARVISWLRQYGVSQINMDLVYGLPHQTVDSLHETIDLAVDFQPRRIALFGYAHVPWMKKHQRLIPEAALPDIAERWRQYDMATHHLVQRGYVQIGLDHFAREDDEMAIALKERRLHRNFQGYTTDAAPYLIGFGASGIGSLPQGYVANEGGIHAYKDTIRAGRLATARGVGVSSDDLLRRALIERLMCDLALDVEAVCARFNADPAQFDDDLAQLTGLEADGLLVRQGRRLTITDEGRPLVRAACAAFDRYLKAGEARHSKAV
ncbi:oxygen-independent coproporphyrinogen III oxidase [Telmatospirillum siberiense]|uniref:Coproporphyrinogen-III oxidase n=1 Tax=Telmatospirillum siberiense TaxID=382514 RepID=A0A2N3PR46_9PROT|nr:oxygen-independent coproporphyrinogen III oxidase [Telmatospirillum siberiense]PKU22875.1 oxygen-independent coproporphyrinogen III oxidase [Telmatospirillum siberiense]